MLDLGVFTRLVAFGLIAGIFSTQTAMANQAETPISQEQPGFDEIAKTRMDGAPKAPPAVAGDVKFSRNWLDQLPDPQGGPELHCLAEALYFEARGETVKGQFAVAEVIMNRVKSERFPGSACSVIHQGTGKKYQCQFTYTCDGRKEIIAEPRAFERVSKVARLVLDGRAPKLTGGATHYHTHAVRPRWSRVFTKTASIGDHIFYRAGYQTASN